VSAAGERAWRYAGALCGLVVLADQASKAAIEANLVPGEEVQVLGPIELTNAHNTGIAFGLAAGSGTGLILLTLAALGLIVVLFARNPARPGSPCLGLPPGARRPVPVVKGAAWLPSRGWSTPIGRWR
jgi:lipoprotein signal peptidase